VSNSASMRRFARQVLSAITCAALLALAPSAARAQAWPNKNIIAVIPFAPGNANDIVGRIVLEQLSKQLGQTIVIENRSGAGGTTGVGSVAKAPPDGYTILVHSSTFSAAYSLYKSLPYDTFNDFVAVVPLAEQPTVLVTAPTKSWKTAGELVAHGKANPGKLNFASAGVGAASHLAAERFRASAGFTAQHIPFRGPVEALTEIITGRLDFYFLPLGPALNLINDGKVTALAVSTPKRAASLPNVPTTAEIGLKDATYAFWNGMFLAAKTPREIIAKLHSETQKALDVPEVQARLARTGSEVMKMTTEEFEKYFRDDVRSTSKLMAEIGVQKID
jgi:tripartite-type tricarboxylate transporter receptor subunit TctC